jgi:Cu(I)/Ag(I) efflux system protein CusF
MKKRLYLIPYVFAGLLVATPLMAQDDNGQVMHDHANVVNGANEAMAIGMLHSINVAERVVNISHEAIPSLSWPEMTMDLPVTKRVDLSALKVGEKVHFTLKKGRDNQFRITSMEPVQGMSSEMKIHHQ